MTLIELLVVIIILTTLVSAAIPIMSPSNDDRRLREASRAVNSFIAGAQANAIALQRPFGVAIKRLSFDTKKQEDNAVSIELYYVEQPSPFVGFNEQSKARVAFYTPTNTSWYGGAKNLVVIQFITPGTSTSQASDGLPTGWDADQFAPGVVRYGDVIVINGTQFKLMSNPSDTAVPAVLDASNVFFESTTGMSRGVVQIVAQPLNDSGQMVNAKYDNNGNELGTVTSPAAPYWTDPASYKILRQPMKNSAEPLQLPEGSAIDLRASGLGSGEADGDYYFYYPTNTSDSRYVDNNQDILIMFAPEGAVSRLNFGRDAANTIAYDQRPTQNLSLLIGKRENCPPPPLASDKTLTSATVPPPGSANREEILADMKKPVNWLRGESRWIVIGSQSGRVVTIENAFVDPTTVMTNYPSLTQPSEPLRSAQIFMAREFVKEMKQLGGR